MKIVKRISNNELFKSSLFMTGSTAFNALSRFLLVTILARYLEPETYGVWVSITSIAAIMMFGDFGITNALRNKLSFLIAEGNGTENLQREYFYTAFYFFLIFALILAFLFNVVSSYLPIERLYNTTNLTLKEEGVEIFVFIQTIFLLSIPFSMASGLFFSYNESFIAAVLNVANSISSLSVVLFYTIVVKVQVVQLAKVYFIVNFLFGIVGIIVFIARRKWFSSFSISIKNAPKRISELFKSGILFLGVQLSNSYILNVPTVFLGAIADLKIAATYNITQKLYVMMITIYQSIFNPIWGKLANLAGKNLWDEVSSLQKKVLLITLTLMFTGILFFTFSSDVIFNFVVGNQYKPSILLTIIMGISFMFYELFEATSLLQNALGRLKLRFIVQIVVALVVNYIFVIGYDLFGILSVPSIVCFIWVTLFVTMYFQGIKIIKLKKNEGLPF